MKLNLVVNQGARQLLTSEIGKFSLKFFAQDSVVMDEHIQIVIFL